MRRSEGQLLIASPYLSDPHFFRSIVYVVRHDDDGAFGLVINRPGPLRLDEVLEESMGHLPARTDEIYLGGPVPGPLVALHTLSGVGDPCGTNACDPQQADVWITSDEDQLRMLADRSDVQARFVAQYSGWGSGQLEAELNAGGWLAAKADLATLFGDASGAWEIMVKRQGRVVLADLIPGDDVGFDPQSN